MRNFPECFTRAWYGKFWIIQLSYLNLKLIWPISGNRDYNLRIAIRILVLSNKTLNNSGFMKIFSIIPLWIYYKYFTRACCVRMWQFTTRRWISKVFALTLASVNSRVKSRILVFLPTAVFYDFFTRAWYGKFRKRTPRRWNCKKMAINWQKPCRRFSKFECGAIGRWGGRGLWKKKAGLRVRQ